MCRMRDFCTCFSSLHACAGYFARPTGTDISPRTNISRMDSTAQAYGVLLIISAFLSEVNGPSRWYYHEHRNTKISFVLESAPASHCSHRPFICVVVPGFAVLSIVRITSSPAVRDTLNSEQRVNFSSLAKLSPKY